MQETMMHFKLITFEGASLLHLHKNMKKQCEITHLGTHLAHWTCPMGHVMSHIYSEIAINTETEMQE